MILSFLSIMRRALKICHLIFLSTTCCFLSCYHSLKEQEVITLPVNRDQPTVFLTPMYNSSENNFTWDVCKELTHSIQHRLVQRDAIHLSEKKKINKKIYKTIDPFSLLKDISLTQEIKKVFPEEDFVIFTKLIKHEEIPLISQNDSNNCQSPAELRISVDLLVIDLRKEFPKVTFHETVERCIQIPKEFNQCNFDQTPWQQEGFYTTPLGLIHRELSREIAADIENCLLKPEH